MEEESKVSKSKFPVVLTVRIDAEMDALLRARSAKKAKATGLAVSRSDVIRQLIKRLK